MSTAVTWNGLTYNVPGTGDQNWSGTTGVDGLLISLANNGFQKTGGLFSLSADVDFGPTNGPVTTYFKSRTANIAQSGVFRLANGDSISFRNAANNADLALTVNSSNNLLFGGNQIIQTTGTITASRVLVSDGSGNIASSSVTSTTLAFLDATSSIQTQLNTKISALTGDVAASGGGSAAATIQANVVSNSKLAQMAANTIKGNNSGSTANAADLTVTQLVAMLTAAGYSIGTAGYYNGYFPGSASNYWSTTSASYVDMTVNGTIPAITQLQASGLTVSGAGSSLPGVTFTAPHTGTLRVSVLVMAIVGAQAGGQTSSFELVEAGGTVIDFMSSQINASTGLNSTQIKLSGYFNVTSSTAYTFKIKAKTNAGTAFIGSGVGDSCLNFFLEYVT